MNVVLDEPPEAQRLQLLNDVWKVVMKLSSPEVRVRTWFLNIPEIAVDMY
jgi:hypothetical protein